jgi:hypothetical protein
MAADTPGDTLASSLANVGTADGDAAIAAAGVEILVDLSFQASGPT